MSHFRTYQQEALPREPTRTEVIKVFQRRLYFLVLVTNLIISFGICDSDVTLYPYCKI